MYPLDSHVDARVVAAVSGFAAHQFVFIRGEWHIHTLAIFNLYMILFFLLMLYQYLVTAKDSIDAFKSSFLLIACHLAALFSGIIAYRAFFHRLKRFPGPFWAKVTKLWHVWHCRTSENHWFLEDLRSTYGDFIRTGPNELTIFHPDGLAAINKSEDNDRGVWYDLIHPSFSLNTIRNKTLHDHRRRVWEPAFTIDAIREYEQRIRKYAIDVERDISCSTHIVKDMNSLCYRFAYSTMHDLAFGHEADQTDHEWRCTADTIRKGLSILGPLSPAPWVALFLFSFRSIPMVHGWRAMMEYCRSKMSHRLYMAAPEKRDILAWMIDDASNRGRLHLPEEHRWLDGDAFSVILAGSDTTASTLIFAFYYLARYPGYQCEIRKELSPLLRNRNDPHLRGLTSKHFQRLPFLNAFINEVLRLHHPLPTAGSRIVRNPSGLIIGKHHIPQGTTVIAPRWSYGRQEAHYKRATEFLPQRWLEHGKNLVLDHKAFTPWGQGNWACLGKPIALFELRFFVALLVQRYKISLPDGDDGKVVEGEFKDQVTACPGRLSLVFQARDQVF